jgi:3-oxoacyl-[acyl-carrier protein] reductase
MLVRSAAAELAPQGILVNAVAPGFILTEMTRKNNDPQQIREIIQDIPLGRLGGVDEVVRWIVHLSSSQNTYVTGQTIVVDGGYTLR